MNVTFASSALTGTVTVTGSANTADVVTATYAGGSPAHTVKMTAVETLNIVLANHGTEVVLDMASVTGLTTINVTDDSSELLELKNLATGVTVDVTSTDAAATELEVKLASVTGSTDSQTFIVAAATANDDVKLITADIETLSISSDTGNQVDLDLSAVSMTTASSVVAVNFTGANDIELIATASQITTINASTMTAGGALVQTARSATDASTYTGSVGDDSFIMMNQSDVIDAGAGTSDTLTITKVSVLGGMAVDLSSTTDQITTFNGAANATVQIGFENVNVLGVTGSFGAEITAISTGSTITGTVNADVINGGAGTDTIQFTGGTAVTAGALVANLGVDVITNFTGGTDKFNFSDTSFADVLTGDAVGSLLEAGVGLYADTDAVINVADGQIDGTGAVAVTNGAFGIVGSNTVGSTVDLYFFDSSATITNSIAVETGTSAVKIATITIVGAALELGDFVSIV
jgi:hypothetical protein